MEEGGGSFCLPSEKRKRLMSIAGRKRIWFNIKDLLSNQNLNIKMSSYLPEKLTLFHFIIGKSHGDKIL